MFDPSGNPSRCERPCVPNAVPLQENRAGVSEKLLIPANNEQEDADHDCSSALYEAVISMGRIRPVLARETR